MKLYGNYENYFQPSSPFVFRSSRLFLYDQKSSMKFPRYCEWRLTSASLPHYICCFISMMSDHPRTPPTLVSLHTQEFEFSSFTFPQLFSSFHSNFNSTVPFSSLLTKYLNSFHQNWNYLHKINSFSIWNIYCSFWDDSDSMLWWRNRTKISEENID